MASVSRRAWIGLAVAAQALVLAFMAGEREWILRTGTVVHLRTAPVDPRDPFRGDFVQLQYDINTVTALDEDLVRVAVEGTGRRARPRHEVVYTRLRPAGEDVYESEGASRTRPDGVFIRGRTDGQWAQGGLVRGRDIGVTYGIEQLFVEQGSGRAIEEQRGNRGTVQVPMEVEVALGRSGTGVIRGYRWSRLGIRLEIVRPGPRRVMSPVPGNPMVVEDLTVYLSPMVRVTLVNVSDAPLTLADSPDHCAFRLLPAGWNETPYEPAAVACDVTTVQVTELAPGQSFVVDLDLATSRWHVLREGKPVEVGALPAGAMFRVEYATPDAAGRSDRLWRGRLATARFNATGAVD
jgi:uncharacterized membrane-anchored protein